jgi:hypothetical protein
VHPVEGILTANHEKTLEVTSFARILAALPSKVMSSLGNVGGKLMVSGVGSELDFIEELRLRRWARENFVPRGERQTSWHPVVHEEMEKKDVEMAQLATRPVYGWSNV